MAKREAVLVIDVGTSKVHANVIDLADGSLASEATYGIPWQHPQPGWTECSPEDLWKAVVESTRACMDRLPEGYSLIAVSTSFQGDGFVPEDKEHNPLYSLIVAMDGRGVPYVEDFGRAIGAERFEEILGCFLGPWEPMKYYWFKKNRPEIFSRIAHITSVQEYVMRRLGLGYCQDYTLAARKVMRDYRQGCWSRELLDFLEMDVSCFDSPIYPSDGICGSVRHVGDVDLGAEVPVIVGAHDCEMGMFGVGVLPGSTKVLANVAGTTDHLGYIETRCVSVKGLRGCIYQGPFDGTYVILGANSVGSAISWGVNNLFPEEPDYNTAISGLFSRIRFAADSRVLHTGGIQSATGTFRGVDLSTTREDLFKALVEGVTYPLADVCADMDAVAGKPFEVIRVGNGGAKSRSWLQLKANLFDRPMERVVNNEISSVGAAALAAVRLGRFGSLAEAQTQMVHVLDRTEPQPDMVRRYQDRLSEWKRLCQMNL